MATSYFFTNTNDLSSNNNQGFGPIDENSFRVTSAFINTGACKAYAVTDGHLFIVPNASDTSKVNVALKPLNPLFMGVKIKYLIYRGIKKSNFYKTVNNNNTVTGSNDPDATPLITQLWDDFNEFNANNPDEDFKVTYLGVDPGITTNEKIIKKFFNKNTYNLPKVKAGQHIGWFNNSLGFEVVVDFGDYVQDTEESGFKLDIDYLKAVECILNLNGSNPENVCGNKPTTVSNKIFRENVFMFLDPAAFYGAHISLASLQSNARRNRNIINTIKYYENPDDGNDHEAFLSSQVYNNIIDRFVTKNALYLYVLGKRGRSVDYYNPPGSTNMHSGVPNFLKTNEWPIKVVTANNNSGITFSNRNFYQSSATTPIPENTIYFNVSFNLTKNEDWDSFFYMDDSLNVKTLIEERHVASVGDETILTLQDFTRITFNKPAFITNITGGIGNIDSDPDRLIISNFVYAYYQQVELLSNTDNYQDIFGPIDLDKVYEPLDYENAGNLIETIVHKKLKLTNFNNSKYLSQTYIVYDTAGSTRLFVAYTVDSVATGFVRSTQELVPRYTIEYDLNLIFNINGALLGDGLRFWKNQRIIDGTTIYYLSISGNGIDYNNLNCSFMLGITESQYAILININSDEKINVHIEFQYLTLIGEGIYRAEIGIKYENSNGDIFTVFPTTGNEIYVYSGNGLIFTTTEFVNTFSYGSQLAQAIMNFLPKENWKGVPTNDWYGIGEYGIDWMRTEPLGSTNIYPPFSESTGVLLGQTNSNQYEGAGLSFEFRPQLYTQLKTQIYDALSIPWGTVPNNEYYTTWLRLGVTEEAILKLKIIVNSVPDRLAIRYESNNYEITVYNGSSEIGSREDRPNQIKDYVLPGSLFTAPSVLENFTIKIRRLVSTIPNDLNRRLEVFATETVSGQKKDNIAGMLKLFQEPDINLNVIIAKVTIENLNNPTGDNVIVSEDIFNKQRSYLDHYLHQAGIRATIASFDNSPVINVSGDSKFRPGGDYVVAADGQNFIAGKITGTAPTGYLPIKDYLRNLLPTAESNPVATVPATTMIVYFINWRAKTKVAATGLAEEPSGQFLGGFSSGRNTDAIMFIDEVTDKITFAHEVYHSLGLGHTFSSFERFSFEPKKMDNVMDYTLLATGSYTTQPSTYYWQWLIARQIAQSWRRR